MSPKFHVIRYIIYVKCYVLTDIIFFSLSSDLLSSLHKEYEQAAFPEWKRFMLPNCPGNHKIPVISPGLIFVQRAQFWWVYFGGAYFWRDSLERALERLPVIRFLYGNELTY